MSGTPAAPPALCLCLVILGTGCAAEHLEARDPTRGPAAVDAGTAAVARPTDLSATEQQLAPEGPKQRPARAPVYVCPMHPEVRSALPGECPKCGMTLQEVAP